MSDIDLFRNKAENIRESQRRRFANVEVVDEIIRLDTECVIREFELKLLNKQQYRISKEVTKLIRAAGEYSSSIIGISEINELEDLISKKAVEVQEARAALDSKLELVANLVHESVPVSNDEANNVVVRTWGEKRTELKLKNHVELVELLEISDLERGAKVGGEGGVFLKDDGVDLNQALINFGLDFLEKKGFARLQYAQFDEELYRVTGEGDDKYLIATAEQALCGYRIDGCIPPAELPL